MNGAFVVALIRHRTLILAILAVLLVLTAAFAALAPLHAHLLHLASIIGDPHHCSGGEPGPGCGN
jgi:hypothetical protein